MLLVVSGPNWCFSLYLFGFTVEWEFLLHCFRKILLIFSLVPQVKITWFSLIDQWKFLCKHLLIMYIIHTCVATVMPGNGHLINYIYCHLLYVTGYGPNHLDFWLGPVHYTFVSGLHHNPDEYCNKVNGGHFARVETEAERQKIRWLLQYKEHPQINIRRS